MRKKDKSLSQPSKKGTPGSPAERPTLKSRLRVLGVLFILFSFVLVIRLYFVQIVYGDKYADQALGQYTASSPESQDRGSIFFTARDGTLVSAAVMQSGWRVAIHPKDIGDPETLFKTLNELIPLDRERFLQSAAKVQDPYEEVAMRLDDAQGAKVRALKLPGVLLVHDQWRFYPGHTLAAHVLGFVGYKGDARMGVYGLERSWEDTLAETSSGIYINPFAEIFANVEALMDANPAAHEGSVVTSIEPAVQQQLEKTLDGVMRQVTPKLAAGIVMDPHTGEIIAMGSRPAFDPNTYNVERDIGVFSNPLVEGRYEMGSIMKPLTMAAGIDTGAVTLATTYNDKGCITLNTMIVCNYDKKARGVTSMQDVLNHSLNLGATFVSDTMGHKVFTDYMHAYQLEQKTGIDLPNEVNGTLASLTDGTGPDVNYSNASFGQGVAVSALEMTRALATLANDGKLPSPHVVTGIKYDNGITRPVSVPASIAVLKPETAHIVTNMLVKVFDDALLDGKIKQEHYSMAAKTGTAQISGPDGKYYGDRYLHSFFGYFPASDPKYIVFLFTVEPHGVQYASASLAMPYLDIAQFLINYYTIPPDR